MPMKGLNLYSIVLANIYLLKVNNRNTRKRCELCLKLTIKTQERRSGVFIIKLWTYLTPFSSASSVGLWTSKYQLGRY